jgi:hypothetical protein
MVGGLALPAFAYADGYVNPAEGGTAGYNKVGCGAGRMQFFASEKNPDADYAFTKDLDNGCVWNWVQIYYVAPSGNWAGWSSGTYVYNATTTALESTTGDMDRSFHRGSND